MDMKKFGKKGRINVTDPSTIITILITILIGFEFLAAMIGPTLTAGDSVQTSGIPLGTLWGSGGVLFIALSGSLILLFLLLFTPKGKGR